MQLVSSPLQILFFIFSQSYQIIHEMFKYTEICHKMRNAWFSLKNKKKERVLITILYAKAFLYAIFLNQLELVSCCLNRCAVVVDRVCDSHSRFVVLMSGGPGFMRKTPWLGPSDRPRQRVSSLPGHSCPRPSSSCGRPGGG